MMEYLERVRHEAQMRRKLRGGRHAAAPEHAVNGGCANAQGLPSPTPERGFVNPFNPCLPYKDSRTCVRHPRFDAMPAPFDSGTPIYYVLN